jgi:hypothetical protein
VADFDKQGSFHQEHPARRIFSRESQTGVDWLRLPTLGNLIMMITVELSKKRIDEEVRALQDATRKLPASRRKALSFLKRIGADGWPDSPTRHNGTEGPRRKKR